ncbi:MAG: hypothetical protein KTR25_06050 [Myxococcales bacterium]|nr:hypothetical protein [Myxococcales bacterium]
MANLLSPQHWIDKLNHGPPALDINDFGEVVDSTWFTNRIGRGNMSITEVVLGPPPSSGPVSGPLKVTSAKILGASPGLRVEDSLGQQFVVKFDPPAYPALASGAEVITTKILHAAGYNVPENTVHHFSLDDVYVSEETSSPSHSELQSILQLANPTRAGEVRALFSRIIPGQAVGSFKYRGTREDDPNDSIPHERRRSLRGYRWFCAWTNNTDTRASNTLDVFRTASGEAKQGHLVHYLIDFGNALGSLGTKAKYASDGYDPLWSWSVVGEVFFSLGLRYRYWLPIQRSRFRSIGFFESEVFVPERWSPSISNPAFAASTPLDAFWAASIMAEFNQAMIKAIVDSAAYPSQAAAEYVSKVLWARRNKILAMAFKRVSPLSHFKVEDNTLQFTDLEVRERLRRYVLYQSVFKKVGDKARFLGISARPAINLRDINHSPLNNESSPFATISIRRSELQNAKSWGPPVHVYLRLIDGSYTVVGLKRGID